MSAAPSRPFSYATPLRQSTVKYQNRWASNVMAGWSCREARCPHLLQRLTTFWRRLVDWCEKNGDKETLTSSAMPTRDTYCHTGRRAGRQNDLMRRKRAERYIRILVQMGLVRRVARGAILAIQTHDLLRPVRYMNVPSRCGSDALIRRKFSTSHPVCASIYTPKTGAAAAAEKPQSRAARAALKQRGPKGQFLKQAQPPEAPQSGAAGETEGSGSSISEAILAFWKDTKRSKAEAQPQQPQGPAEPLHATTEPCGGDAQVAGATGRHTAITHLKKETKRRLSVVEQFMQDAERARAAAKEEPTGLSQTKQRSSLSLTEEAHAAEENQRQPPKQVKLPRRKHKPAERKHPGVLWQTVKQANIDYGLEMQHFKLVYGKVHNTAFVKALAVGLKSNSDRVNIEPLIAKLAVKFSKNRRAAQTEKN